MKPAIITVFLVSLFTLSARAAEPAAVTARPDKPNVLFIAVDDLRPDFGCYGNAEVRSPHMDRLAAEGLLFRRAYCQYPLCMPSRASVLSGYRPESINNTHRVSGRVPGGTVTLPQLFRTAGYTTVSVGKVYHENDDNPAAWVRRHTDTFAAEGKWCNGYCSGYQLQANRDTVQNYLQGKRRQGLPASAIAEITDTPDDRTPDGLIARLAVEELRRFKQSGEPFFLAAGFYRPHMPLTAPKKYWDLYDRSRIELPANFPRPPGGPRSDWDEVRRYGDCPLTGPMPVDKAREIIHGYHASVTFVDVQVGRVLDELRRLALDRSTVVVLWSDNSWRLGEHGLWSKPACSEVPTRIAMMLKVPWLAASGSTSALVELVDIYPTLAELCRLPAPGYLEGTSMVPLLGDPKRAWKTAAFSRVGKIRTMRTDRFRLIQHPSGQLELYDHRHDGAEDRNLAQDPAHANTLKELQALLAAGWRAARPPGPAATPSPAASQPSTRPAPAAGVVCFGDSITVRGYPAELARLLNVPVANAGVGGQTTAAALRRIRKDVLDRKPRAVVILFGTNDSRLAEPGVCVPVAKYQANLEKMVDLCRSVGASPVLCTIPPIAEQPYFTRHARTPFEKVGGLAKALDQYRAAARAAADDRKVPLVDLGAELAKKPEWLSPDGVHPTKEGNAIIARLVAPVVKAILDGPAATTRPAKEE